MEETLHNNWGNFLDHIRLMRKVMEDVRDTTFNKLLQQNLPPRQVKFSVTKFSLNLKSRNESYDPDYAFEFWVEYSIPKDQGVVIGTNIYLLSFQGDLKLHKSFGTQFISDES